MTWEEIILKIRTDAPYAELVEKAYFDSDLNLNVRRFSLSEEFEATLKLIEQYAGKFRNQKILDIGAGNGISSVAFAKLGYEVTAVEPDLSETVGSGAILWLKKDNNLDSLSVISSFGENIPLPEESFDIVYIRQAMHHAADLAKFVSEAVRKLKPGGLFITIRDHVIYNDKDKEWFLQEHPLHKFYGGENAFSEKEYLEAMLKAGLEIKQTLKHFDSVINYFPITVSEYEQKRSENEKTLKGSLQRKIGFFSRLPFIYHVYCKWASFRNGKPFDEKNVPGRMYSFIAQKSI